jgi:hypothetical protein
MGTGAICQIGLMKGIRIADISTERVVRAFELCGHHREDEPGLIAEYYDRTQALVSRSSPSARRRPAWGSSTGMRLPTLRGGRETPRRQPALPCHIPRRYEDDERDGLHLELYRPDPRHSWHARAGRGRERDLQTFSAEERGRHPQPQGRGRLRPSAQAFRWLD